MESEVVSIVESTRTEKLIGCSATWAPKQTCPESCSLLDKGCYCQHGHSAFTFNRITRAVKSETTQVFLATEEGKGILKLKGDKPLRIHVSGDCKTSFAATVLSQAADVYQSKFRFPVWTYTHSWDKIPRECWGPISVLASCETLEEAQRATKRGYAVAWLRFEPFTGTLPNLFQGYRMTACRNETENLSCIQCRLCFNDKKLIEQNRAICFFPHGTKQTQIKERLKTQYKLERM